MKWQRIKRVDEEARFWSKVDKQGPGGCWLWNGTVNNVGRGTFARQLVNGKYPDGKASIQAHRYAWQVTKGPLLPGFVLRHRCDVPLCVNPKHLEPGTQGDNNRDTSRRGRRFEQKAKARIQELESQLAAALGARQAVTQ